ncbi:MAG TPA: hypothetical protein VFA20_10050 [Myxococcaceae bacterium]|nr:hypothetical protein [Myxococcaceae bacterium]
MRRLALLSFATLVLGCSFFRSVSAGPSKDALQPTVDLLARGFLVRGEQALPGFGYYAYLVFLDAGESTRPQREAAVRAFARLLEDARELDSLQVPRERLAVLYVPVKKNPGERPPPEDILELYDYAAAQLLTVEIERRGASLPRLFLLGSTTPIQPRASTLPPDLRVVELKGDQQAIEATVQRFRDNLLAPDRPAFAAAMLERVRTFFESVGGFVLSVGAVNGSPSKP